MTKHLVILFLAILPLAQSQTPTTVGFDRPMAEHLLNRAGFGGTPEDCDRLVALGLEGAVDHILSARAGESAALPRFEPTVLGRPGRAAIRDRISPDLSKQEREEALRKFRQEFRRKDRRQITAYRAWWMQRLLDTPAPLQERMVLFWHGHFTSGYRDVRNSYHLIRQNQLFRKHALGNFKTLLHAVSKDPAMLEYLDNNRNRRGRPNENFAREVMELFTLGAGNYTEKDIKEAARAFTGWTFRGNEFFYEMRRHDFGKKTVLGVTARLRGERVLDILLAQDAAPRWVAGKLLRHFLGTDPDDAMLARYAGILRQQDWEIRPFLQSLFTDPAFYDGTVVGGRILGPVELLVGVCRRLGEHPPGALLANVATLLGQELMQPPDVKGWDGGAAWITTSTFLARGNFAGYLVEGISPRKLFQDFMRDAPAGKDDKKQPPPERMKGANRKMDRTFRGVARARYTPRVRLRSFIRKATSAETVVDILCDRLLAVPVTVEARAGLVHFLRGEEPAANFRMPDERRLKRLARLILSLPEAQIG
ncbi:MAG: hypothetical protein CMJ83_22855 [Planctomycetes bacterium]|nr:hypothetical protein [Planctomycetota bacterium]